MGTTYVTIKGDTWDYISKFVYGTENEVGRLMEANPALVDYFVFPSGIKVFCPEIPEEENANLPDWRK